MQTMTTPHILQALDELMEALEENHSLPAWKAGLFRGDVKEILEEALEHIFKEEYGHGRKSYFTLTLEGSVAHDTGTSEQ